MEYNFKEIEPKWQRRWQENKTYKVETDPSRPKFYVLDMFPYPSGAGLHVGHPLGYIASDIYSRYKRQKGFNVLHPMGYDAFGLPAEQYAIQTGQHPAVTTERNIARYREQLDKIGFSFDWDREVRTCDPAYYKWTQWAFLKMFGSYYCYDKQQARPIEELTAAFEQGGTQGLNVACSQELHFTAEEWRAMPEEEKERTLHNYRLAFRADTMVNWCPKLGTVLANDEVHDGLSVRGGHPVEQKRMKQWLLRVTAYAQRMLDGLDRLAWSDSLKEIQRNWIGRSEGAELDFGLTDKEGNPLADRKLTVFTTRPDTAFGVTYMVLAPEHKYVAELADRFENKDEIRAYVEATAKKSELQRTMDDSKTGVELKGIKAKNPYNGELIPVFISDYVLTGYGTGAIMAVPAHDQRDYDFAKAFNLPIVQVLEGGDIAEKAWEEDGAHINSGFLNGMNKEDGMRAAIDHAVKNGFGRAKVNFKLRDWVFSRQRYWGEPIPMVYCEHCGWQPVPESELPLKLPQVPDYHPNDEGESPLSKAFDWVNTTCPKCGGKARRETDVMPNWAGSSWYFLRYCDPHNDREFASKEALDYWMNVDWYNGGMEHTTLHLLYSRFWHKFLYDLGLVPTKEPYKKGSSHGMILAANGEKMSKSRGNVINPDDIVNSYGADTFRMYEMFIGPFDQVAMGSDESLIGVYRFVGKIYGLMKKTAPVEASDADLRAMHKCILEVSERIDQMRFNTAVSSLMTYVNYMSGLEQIPNRLYLTLLKLISPFAPHLAEEMWARMGQDGLIVAESWPEGDPKLAEEDTVTMAVQICGKMRGTIEVKKDAPQAEVEAKALALDNVVRQLEGREVKKIIVVPNRIVNIVA